MNKCFATTLAVGCLLFLCLQPAAAENSWELVEETKGIRLYKKNMADSRYHAFKAVGEINAVMATVGEVLRDVSAYPEWMATMKEARVLKQYDADNMDVYLVMNIPFPFQDRDAVVKAKTSLDASTGEVTTRSEIIKNSAVPEKDGLVRLPGMAQTFQLVYKTYDTTEVTFTLHVETGGVLPVTAVNMVTQSVPYKSLQNLRKMVREEKYRTASPFAASNIGITKGITSSILRQHITDPDIIKMVISDRKLLEIAIRNGAAKEGLTSTAGAIIKKYLQTPLYATKIKDSANQHLLARLATDQRLLDRVLADHELAELVLRTGGMTDQVLTALAVQTREALETSSGDSAQLRRGGVSGI